VPITEICSNGVDDNCNGQIDEGCTGCSTDGTWYIDGGTFNYSCAFGIVTIMIDRFNFSNGATQVTINPLDIWQPNGTGSPGPLMGAPTTCPTGPVDAGVFFPGTCAERYVLEGNFTSPNSWVGVLKMTYTGGPANCLDCASQTIPMQLYR
jgi:hypothetical protein